MTKEEIIREHLVKEMMKLQERIKKTNPPTELAEKICSTCNNILEGEDIDRVIDALLVFAYDVAMQHYMKKRDEESIKEFGEFMEHRASLMFTALSGMLILNNILHKLTGGEKP